jgi:hypothetical protein
MTARDHSYVHAPASWTIVDNGPHKPAAAMRPYDAGRRHLRLVVRSDGCTIPALVFGSPDVPGSEGAE